MRVKYLPQDAEARLNNGICFYEGAPYFLTLLSQTQCQLVPLYPESSFKKINTPLSDEKLDISSPKLGYVNLRETCAYVSRRPERRYRQTLSSQSMYVQVPLGQDRLFGLNSLVASKEFEDMLLEKYEFTLTQSIKLLTNKARHSVAISRNVALARDSFDIIHVFYKMDDVGTIDPKRPNTVSVPKGELAWVVSRYLEGFDWVVE